MPDLMSADELRELEQIQTVLVPGQPFLFLGGFGWGWIGYYIKHLTPNKILVAHCSHFANAGVDYGRICTQGPASSVSWRYEGRISEINTIHILKVTPYMGKVVRESN